MVDFYELPKPEKTTPTQPPAFAVLNITSTSRHSVYDEIRDNAGKGSPSFICTENK